MKLKEEQVHLFFKIGIAIKGVDGVLETIAGVALLFVSPASLGRLVDWPTHGELQEDPNDFIARHLVNFSQHLSIGTKHFAAICLLVYGMVKVGLAAGLWRGKLRAYPVALIVLGLFLVYQIYRLTHTHSPGLALVSVLDFVILALIWRDYRYRRERRRPA